MDKKTNWIPDTTTTIRALRTGDTEALIAFYRELPTETRRSFDPFSDDPVTRITRHLTATEADQDLSIGLITDSAIVGHAFLMRLSDPNPVFGIGITPAWQHRGYGRLMSHRILDRADALGAGAVTLTVLKSNTIAITLYLTLGFSVRGDHTFRTCNDSMLMIRKPAIAPDTQAHR